MQKSLKLTLLCTIFLVCSCDLFKTRSVEPPSEARSTFTQPTSPAIVLDNLIFAVIEKNLDNYMRCFVDTNFSSRRYTYFPDAVSQSSYPVFANWTLGSERAYYSNLIIFTDPNAPSNFFQDNVIVNASIDSAIVDMDYIFVFNHNRSSAPRETKGKLRFRMATDVRGLWSVHSWSDFINANNDTTWSVMKANFVN